MPHAHMPLANPSCRAHTLSAETKALEQAGELEVQSGELASYKKMCDGLKNKIRELSSKDGDSKDFMDSFEEGM